MLSGHRQQQMRPEQRSFDTFDVLSFVVCLCVLLWHALHTHLEILFNEPILFVAIRTIRTSTSISKRYSLPIDRWTGWTWHLSELLQQQHGLESYELNRKVVAITIFLCLFLFCFCLIFSLPFYCTSSVCCVCRFDIMFWMALSSFTSAAAAAVLCKSFARFVRSFMHRLTNNECQFNYCQMTFSNSFMRCICHWSHSSSSTCPGLYTICPWPI